MNQTHGNPLLLRLLIILPNSSKQVPFNYKIVGSILSLLTHVNRVKSVGQRSVEIVSFLLADIASNRLG
jgi:hypothetical protein